MSGNRLSLRLGSSLFLFLACLALAGCATTARDAANVADYLNVQESTAKPGVPVLALPLRVGVAFVPGRSGFAPADRSFFIAKSIGQSKGSTLTEGQRLEVLEQVSRHFKNYPFVKSIEIIPTSYLTRNGGFENLDRIREMHDVDAMVLLSYDQTQFTDEGALAATYLTIIGAFVVPGEKTSTHTMLDASVYDIRSRKMLFRAQGTSQIEGRATLVNLGEEMRAKSAAGFKSASDQLIRNLEARLVAFRDTVRERPADYTVIRPAGYKDGLH